MLETRETSAEWKGDAVIPSTLKVTGSVPANSHEGVREHIYSPAQRPREGWETSAYTLTLLPLGAGQQRQGTAACFQKPEISVYSPRHAVAVS